MMRALRLRHILRSAGMPAALAAAMLLTGGCGGDDTAGGGPAPVKSGSPAAAGVVLTLTGNEFSFTPKAVKASPGSTTIRFTNSGAVEHDFSIKSLRVKLVAQPGKTAETTLTLEPGTYKTTCSVPGHSQSGMQGTLTVS